MTVAAITLEELVGETVWLRRLAQSLVKDQAAVDDLVQDTYLVAAEHAPTDGRPLRPWLARVLVNRVRTGWRGGERRRKREQAVADLAVPPAAPDEIVDRIKLQRSSPDGPSADRQRDVVLPHLPGSDLGRDREPARSRRHRPLAAQHDRRSARALI